jgi:hypothetical protein
MKPILKNQLRSRGFALVVTISLLVLLMVLGVGLLSLSVITLRASSQGAARAEARANARLALLMAIGQLQKHAGDDRRISRAADQIPADDEGNETAAAPGRRFWTGIYDAWDDQLKDRPEPQLRAWLVSDPDPDSVADDEPTKSNSPGRMAELVGPATTGDRDEDFVEAPMIGLARGGRTTGKLAWWTGDQGLKAMLATPAVDTAKDLAEVRARLQAAPSHAVQLATTTNGEPFRDLDRSDRRLDALTGWPQASLLASDLDSPKELFHDLTSSSSGLLVDVRRGGFRRDLSMELERETPSPDALYTVNREKGINWEELHAYYQLYRRLERVSGRYTTGGSIPRDTLGFRLGANPQQCIDDPDFHFKMPAVVSLQVVFSLQARPVGGGRDPLNRLYLALDPIVTFWNPLDVPVVIPTTAWLSFNFFQFPYTFEIRAGRDRYECPLVASLSGATVDQNRDTNFLGLRMGEIEQIVLKPGEVIKLSQVGDQRVEGNSPNRALQAKAGFNYGGGLARPMRDQSGRYLDVRSGTTVYYTMRPNGLTVGQTSRSGRSMTGANQHTRHFGLHYHQFFVGSERPNAGGIGYGGMSIDYDFGNQIVKRGNVRLAGTPGTKSARDRIYANRSQHADVFPTFGASQTRPLPVGQLLTAKAPVLMYTYSAKTEMTSPTGTRTMLRSNPRSHKIDFYALDDYELDLNPFDFQVEALNSWVNRKLETSASGNAFYGGSYDAADGTSFVTVCSVPREPIHSLGALQHSMANGFTLQAPQQGYTSLNARQPMLPQISHAIGNSHAPAVMAPGETSRIISGGRPVADHSYLANEALWDGWFFSSAAPQEQSSYSSRRTQRQVVSEFLERAEPLPITRYKPNPGEATVSEVIGKLFERNGTKLGASEVLAPLIRVEGMFNVNSTSVEAWRVLLASLLGEDIITRDESGKLTRTAVPGDAPVAGSMAPADEVADGKGLVSVRDPAQWVGRRVLNEDEITLLAEAIVREVRMRGPFLSLADFVNRRVSSDPKLSRAGAIQNALDSKEVPINEAYNEGSRAVAADVAGRLPFPEAEEGAASAGIPGIVKQADLLTPLAPILSARSDTFLIRAYGEAVGLNGSVTARAWCEAQVERSADFINRDDPRETRPDNLKNQENKSFGRRFRVHSFRWLGPRDI